MPTRRGQGKSDDVDAGRIARSVLGVDTQLLRRPRADTGPRVALRVLVVAREQLNNDRTRAINSITALTRTVDLGIDTHRPLTTTQIRTIAAWRAREEPDWLATCRAEAVRLADREGVDGLSMRRLADALGAGAMSLYHYVASKEELLDAMIDIVFEEIELPPVDTGWQSAMRRAAGTIWRRRWCRA